MKLSKEEIKFIDNYLIKSEVKFWDVRLELLDHIVSSVEDKIENEGVSFNEALLETHRGFGNQFIEFGVPNKDFFGKGLYQSNIGFKKFIRKKQKEIGRKHRKNYRKTFLSFLTSSRFIVEFILLDITIYSIYQFNPKTAFVIVIIACVIPELSKIGFGAFEKANRKSLNMQMATATGSLFMSLNYFFIAGFGNYYEDVTPKPYFIAIIFYVVLFPFLRHSLNCYRTSLNENKKDYKLLTS
ncbi:hypothetical protein [Winogradskyella sp.]|uniref:hypothetical protein n=1 Tax=Winogradskyella sp. TaxID=1883156 RepID=UPI0025F0D15E|nr:hypothetical protein [Winogradskyella sp.]